MVQQFNVIDEARKHPGVTAGTVAVVATAALVTLFLAQRSGPRRYELLRDRLDPRGWIDAEALRHRFEDIQRGLTGAAGDLGDRADDLGQEARHKAEGLFQRGKDALLGGKRRRYAREARHYADRAGKRARHYADAGLQYGRDHAREGGALLAVATIAAAIGAAALESRRPDSRVRRIAKF
jgi:hypothetical protein